MGDDSSYSFSRDLQDNPTCVLAVNMARTSHSTRADNVERLTLPEEIICLISETLVTIGACGTLLNLRCVNRAMYRILSDYMGPWSRRNVKRSITAPVAERPEKRVRKITVDKNGRRKTTVGLPLLLMRSKYLLWTYSKDHVRRTCALDQVFYLGCSIQLHNHEQGTILVWRYSTEPSTLHDTIEALQSHADLGPNVITYYYIPSPVLPARWHVKGYRRVIMNRQISSFRRNELRRQGLSPIGEHGNICHVYEEQKATFGIHEQRLMREGLIHSITFVSLQPDSSSFETCYSLDWCRRIGWQMYTNWCRGCTKKPLPSYLYCVQGKTA